MFFKCTIYMDYAIMLSGLVLITKTTRVVLTEVEDCFTEDIMPDCPDDQSCNTFAEYLLENYMTFDSKFTPDMWAGIPSEEKRLIIAQSRFMLTLTNSSAHLSQPFSYFVSSCYDFQLP